MLSLSFLQSTGSISPRRVHICGVDHEIIEKTLFLKVKSEWGYSWVPRGVDPPTLLGAKPFSESTGSISPRRVHICGVVDEFMENDWF